jgi:hypothetical protein
MLFPFFQFQFLQNQPVLYLFTELGLLLVMIIIWLLSLSKPVA